MPQTPRWSKYLTFKNSHCLCLSTYNMICDCAQAYYTTLSFYDVHNFICLEHNNAYRFERSVLIERNVMIMTNKVIHFPFINLNNNPFAY